MFLTEKDKNRNRAYQFTAKHCCPYCKKKFTFLSYIKTIIYRLKDNNRQTSMFSSAKLEAIRCPNCNKKILRKEHENEIVAVCLLNCFIADLLGNYVFGGRNISYFAFVTVVYFVSIYIFAIFCKLEKLEKLENE